MLWTTSRSTCSRWLKTRNRHKSVRSGSSTTQGEGAYAVDQSGRRQTNKEVRVYLYPDEVDRVLYVILIGDKSSQQREDNE